MPRIARVVAVGYPHHITQRGNYRQDIFTDDNDRAKYLSLLARQRECYGLRILGYCLMTNHVHFIAVPEQEDSMGNVFKYVNMKYSQYYNKKSGAGGGHLFQGRFFSCVMDERHTVVCARYIERNPVRARMVRKPTNYEWSSARIHCSRDLVDTMGVQAFFKVTGEREDRWDEFINEPDNTDEIRAIKQQTRKGRPLGGETFIKRLEKKLERSLQLKPLGRPKKKKK